MITLLICGIATLSITKPIVVVGVLPELGAKPQVVEVPSPVTDNRQEYRVELPSHSATIREEGTSFASFFPGMIRQEHLYPVLPGSVAFPGLPLYDKRTVEKSEPQTRLWSVSADLRLPAGERLVQVSARTASGRTVELLSPAMPAETLFPRRPASEVRFLFADRLYHSAAVGPPPPAPKFEMSFGMIGNFGGQ